MHRTPPVTAADSYRGAEAPVEFSIRLPQPSLPEGPSVGDRLSTAGSLVKEHAKVSSSVGLGSETRR